MRAVLGRIRGRRHAPPPAGSRRGRARSDRVKKGEGRGTVDAGPTGYPAREREDLVQVGFFPCNLSNRTITNPTRKSHYKPTRTLAS